MFIDYLTSITLVKVFLLIYLIKHLYKKPAKAHI